MRCEIRSGGDGVECWNTDAIQSYTAEVTERELALSGRNPDLVISPGRVSCYGCEVQEYGYGTKCSAQLTKTTYSVDGEVKPRAADAAGWHREIPGLLTIKPDSVVAAAGDPAAQPAAASVSTSPVKGGGRRSIFGRHG